MRCYNGYPRVAVQNEINRFGHLYFRLPGYFEVCSAVNVETQPRRVIQQRINNFKYGAKQVGVNTHMVFLEPTEINPF